MSNDIEGALREAIDQWNDGNLDGYLELYDPRVKLHGYSPEPLDKAGVVDRYRMVWKTLAAAGKSHPLLEILEVISVGQKLACRFTMSGIHQGDFLGLTATQKSYRQPGMTIMHFENLRVVERWSVTDRLSVLGQLGVFP